MRYIYQIYTALWYVLFQALVLVLPAHESLVVPTTCWYIPYQTVGPQTSELICIAPGA